MSNETQNQAATDLSDIPIRWQGDFLFAGAVGLGFVGYDMHRAPCHFSACIGSSEYTIGWFATRDEARERIVKYVREGISYDTIG